MEGNNSHGYLQEDVSYDDLMNSSGWPPPTDQYSYQPPHTVQGSYPSPYSNQPSFDQYGLQQSSYPSLSYTNSPYTTHTQPQYQHARPSDVFGPTSYNLDPSLQSSAAYPTQGSFSFGPHGGDNITIAPQTLQYQMASAQPPIARNVPIPAFQRSAGDSSQQAQDPIYFSSTQNGNLQNSESQIRFSAFQSGSLDPESKQNSKRFSGLVESSSIPTPTPTPRAQQVKAEVVRSTLRITHPELHAAKNPSTRPRFENAPFLSWEDVPIQVAPGLKNTLPKYHPRKSRSGKELVPGLDMSRTSTPARISTKKMKVRTPKEPKVSISKYKGTSQGPKVTHGKLVSLRSDDNDLATVKSPSTPTETSSSEDESGSEEESEYEEDEDMPVMNISQVRAPTRPTDAADAAGWDAIGIIWKDPKSNPNGDAVKGAIEEYGNFVSALRVQLKTNSIQTEEAASRPADVNRLKGARRVLLESLYQTINAANTHGYSAIVENLGSHQKLVNGLTTTLIECIKTEDFLGKLPKAVFSLLAKFQNMSDALLKKLKFDSIQKRWNKKGDDKIKKDITAILANTTEAKEKASKAKMEATQAEEAKNFRDKTEQTKQRISEPVKATSNSNPAKRPHDGDSVSIKPSKKFASDVAGTPSTTSKPIPLKRPTNLLANNLLGISSKPAAKPAPKKREPSPPTESKLGALLAQIAEPVKPPKAPEAKPLPPETPEQKKRRERKESRRHLRVKFKDEPYLEEIRFFKHEQAEDEGRQDDMLRDAHDDRSEGMMHKKRVSDMDSAMELEDDDYNPEDIEFEERAYPDLVSIDFSDLEKRTKYGPTYSTRGGEMVVTTPEQQAQERREALELMVVYTDPKDIPPTPKEPLHRDIGSLQQERELRGPSEPWVVQRLQEIQLYGPEYASQMLQQRKIINIQENERGTGQLHQSSSSNNANSVLQQLSGPTSQLSHSQTDNTMESAAWENLERIVDSLKGKPFPPIEPPNWMTNPAQRADWWDGYNRDKAAKEKSDADAQISQLQAAHYQQPPLLPPQPPPTIVNPFPPPLQPNMTQNTQNYLGGIQASSNTNSTANSGGPSLQQYDYNSWPGSNGQDGEFEERGRWNSEREKENSRPRKKQGHNKSNSNTSKDRGYDMKTWSGGFGNDGPLDENGEYRGKKKPCRFWADGKCAKGTKCTYLHDESQ